MLQTSFSRPLFAIRLLGVPVQVEVTFLFTTFLLAGGERVNPESFGIWLGVVFVSVVVHELGHALVGRRFGLTPSVRLHGWGGLTSWTAGPAPTPLPRLGISLAGPFADIALGAACFLALRAVPADARLVRHVLGDFVWAAGFWGLVNLAPLLPLDGGHACEAILARFAPAHEQQVARLVSAGTGLLLGALALDRGWVLGGAAALWLGFESARAFRAERSRQRDEGLTARLDAAFRRGPRGVRRRRAPLPRDRGAALGAHGPASARGSSPTSPSGTPSAARSPRPSPRSTPPHRPCRPRSARRPGWSRWRAASASATWRPRTAPTPTPGEHGLAQRRRGRL